MSSPHFPLGSRCTPRPTDGHRAAPNDLSGAAHPLHLLVVASRGRGGSKGMLLGSVSQNCLHHAGCTVVVVR